MKADSTGAPDRATAFTTNNDAAILAAWDRRNLAYAAYQKLAKESGDGDYTPSEQAQWDLIDMAELLIRSVVAKTPRGVEIQIWCALHHELTDSEQVKASRCGDLDWFREHDDEMDWCHKLLLTAIYSLRAMGGAA